MSDSITECPKCGTKLIYASGIGDFCPNKGCDVVDDILPAAGLAPPLRWPNPPTMEVDEALAILRRAGWTCLPPV